MTIDLKDLLNTTDDKPSDYPPHSGFSLTYSDREIANKMNEIQQKRIQLIVDMLYQVRESRVNIDMEYLIDEQEEANLYMDTLQTYLDKWNAEKKSAK